MLSIVLHLEDGYQVFCFFNLINSWNCRKVNFHFLKWIFFLITFKGLFLKFLGTLEYGLVPYNLHSLVAYTKYSENQEKESKQEAFQEFWDYYYEERKEFVAKVDDLAPIPILMRINQKRYAHLFKLDWKKWMFLKILSFYFY